MKLNEIKSYLESPNPQNRMKAIVELRNHNPSVVVPLLKQRMYDKEFVIRSFVAMGLGYKRNEEGFQILLDLIENEQDPNVKAEAANSLANYGERAIPYLLELFKTESHWLIRQSIFAVMNEINSPDLLFKLACWGLQGDDLVVKFISIATLGRLNQTSYWWQIHSDPFEHFVGAHDLQRSAGCRELLDQGARNAADLGLVDPRERFSAADHVEFPARRVRDVLHSTLVLPVGHAVRRNGDGGDGHFQLPECFDRTARRRVGVAVADDNHVLDGWFRVGISVETFECGGSHLHRCVEVRHVADHHLVNALQHHLALRADL